LQEKPTAEFYPDRRRRFSSQCKPCNAERQKEFRKRHAPYIRKQESTVYAERRWNSHLKRKYGIDASECCSCSPARASAGTERRGVMRKRYGQLRTAAEMVNNLVQQNETLKTQLSAAQQRIKELESQLQMEQPQEGIGSEAIYRLDRYRNGVRKAEGAKVHARNEEEAKAKAAKLFYESGDEFQPWYPETFVVRDQSPRSGSK
jgi:hypothetical protein